MVDKQITYRVPIRCIATGETIVHEETLPWYDSDSDEGDSLHWWTDGDMGCDCNRHLLFMRAKHGEGWDGDEEIKCGDRERYFISFIEFPNGSKITCDEES